MKMRIPAQGISVYGVRLREGEREVDPRWARALMDKGATLVDEKDRERIPPAEAPPGGPMRIDRRTGQRVVERDPVTGRAVYRGDSPIQPWTGDPPKEALVLTGTGLGVNPQTREIFKVVHGGDLENRPTVPTEAMGGDEEPVGEQPAQQEALRQRQQQEAQREGAVAGQSWQQNTERSPQEEAAGQAEPPGPRRQQQVPPAPRPAQEPPKR